MKNKIVVSVLASALLVSLVVLTFVYGSLEEKIKAGGKIDSNLVHDKTEKRNSIVLSDKSVLDNANQAKEKESINSNLNKQQDNGKKLEDRTLLKCSTYVNNLTTGRSNWRDLCCQVTQGQSFNLNEYIYDESRKKKENEGYKFSVYVLDNTNKTSLSYTASFWLYEETDDIKQYHNVHENHEIKALIFDKNNYCWQILLYQNYQYKVLSCYMGMNFINAFDIDRASADY